jgi:hypothetical protein
MNEIVHFKVFLLYNGDVAADMEYLHVKRIHLVSFSYIVIEDESRNISKKINNQILYCFQPFKSQVCKVQRLSRAQSFSDWWHQAIKDWKLKKGLNSFTILVAWEIRTHPNDCVLSGASSWIIFVGPMRAICGVLLELHITAACYQSRLSKPLVRLFVCLLLWHVCNFNCWVSVGLCEWGCVCAHVCCMS